MGSLRIPLVIDDVDVAWLDGALTGHPKFDSQTIVGFSSRPIGVGIGQVSALALLDLEFDRAGPAPGQVVLKLQTTFEDINRIAVDYRMYEREVQFYSEIAGQLPVRTPEVYHASYDGEGPRCAIVMEYLDEWHMVGQVSGPTLAQAELAVDNLAKLHAATWNGDVLGADWLPTLRTPYIFGAKDDYVASLPEFIQRFGDDIGESGVRAAERIGRSVGYIFEQMSEGTRVLTHFDYRLENMFFRSEPEPDVAVLDWQFVLQARPAWDLAYFIGTNLTHEERQRHLPALLDRYVEGIRSHGVKEYDRATCERDFRLGMAGITCTAVIGGSAYDTTNERSKALFHAIATRSFAAVEELDSLSELPS